MEKYLNYHIRVNPSEDSELTERLIEKLGDAVYNVIEEEMQTVKSVENSIGNFYIDENHGEKPLHSVRSQLGYVAYAVIEQVRNHLYELREQDYDITQSFIEAQIDSTISLHLTEEDQHIQTSIREVVDEQISIDDLLEEYGDDE